MNSQPVNYIKHIPIYFPEKMPEIVTNEQKGCKERICKALEASCKEFNNRLKTKGLSPELIGVARKNFELAKALKDEMVKEIEKAKKIEKPKSFPARFARLVKAKINISLGPLGAVKKICKEYDHMLGSIQKQVVSDLKSKGFYKKITNEVDADNLLDKLKDLGRSLTENERMVVLTPMIGTEQELAFFSVKKGSHGEPEFKRGSVRYLGNNQQGSPRFLIKGDLTKGNRHEDIEVIGIENLKDKIAFQPFAFQKGPQEAYSIVTMSKVEEKRSKNRPKPTEDDL
jgi:hypothetical protein